MAWGPGKYDKECTEIFTRTRADGVLLVVFNGTLGTGFSCTVTGDILMKMPQILRQVADQIEQRRNRNRGGAQAGAGRSLPVGPER